MKKPNQIIDPVLELVYPPSKAIVPQLAAIRSNAISAIKVYESTEDIHSILPNLDTMQCLINYLRGAPILDELRPTPTDILKPVYIPSVPGLTIVSSLNKENEYDVSIVGLDVEPEIAHPELFGDIDFDAVEIKIKIPVVCGKTYLIAQENPALEHYISDESVIEYEGNYIKEKEYYMEEDELEYVFLLLKGRTKVKISIYADYEEPIVFNITSHIHFKKQEEESGGDNIDEENSGPDGEVGDREELDSKGDSDSVS